MADTEFHSHVNSLPSDYADVQPKTYDPQFISRISNKMQIPDRLGAVDGMEDTSNFGGGDNTPMAAVSMQVPESISLHDNEQRRKFDRFEFGDQGRNMNYVGLMTPPRTLTMEEAFAEHAVADEAEETVQKPVSSFIPNGDTYTPVPYTPGQSLSDSILHNEDDDATQLRTQVAKLYRRVSTLEQENQKRYTRELILYPLVFGYLFTKVFSWMFRSSKY